MQKPCPFRRMNAKTIQYMNPLSLEHTLSWTTRSMRSIQVLFHHGRHAHMHKSQDHSKDRLFQHVWCNSAQSVLFTYGTRIYLRIAHCFACIITGRYTATRNFISGSSHPIGAPPEDQSRVQDFEYTLCVLLLCPVSAKCLKYGQWNIESHHFLNVMHVQTHLIATAGHDQLQAVALHKCPEPSIALASQTMILI